MISSEKTRLNERILKRNSTVLSSVNFEYAIEQCVRNRDLLEKQYQYPSIDREEVKNVIVVLSGPRSGSSLLNWILRQSIDVIAPQGEHTPFYKLAGIQSGNILENGDSVSADEVTKKQRENWWKYLQQDLTVVDRSGEASDLVVAIMSRLVLQWPFMNLNYEKVLGAVVSAAERASYDGKSTFPFLYKKIISNLFDEEQFFSIASQFDNLDLEYRAASIGNKPEAFEYFIAERPYVAASYFAKPKKKDWNNKKLLLKASVDCLRPTVIASMFPNAEIKVVNLIRNPAASINGLYDGWGSENFTSHVLPSGSLKISNYSEVASFGDTNWKYELIPNWRSYTAKPLIEVCAAQWLAANRSMYDFVSDTKIDTLRVKFESILNETTRKDTISKIFEFCNISENAYSGPNYTENLPVLMATMPPRPRRWFQRKSMIDRVLANDEIRQLIEFLGYNASNEREWI